MHKERCEEIQEWIAKQAMKGPEWAIAYGLLEVSWALRFVGSIVAGPMDDCAGVNRIGAELGRIADRMQGLETEAQRAIRKGAAKAELASIEGIEVGEEGVRVTYKGGERKFVGRDEGLRLYQRWTAYGGERW
jgi:hypothetical protein